MPSDQQLTVDDRQIEAVRAFGRFYTTLLGVLREGLHDSPFSLTEARVIYELAQRGTTDAGTITAELALNAGYMSRLISRLEKQRLVSKSTSTTDKRIKLLALTPGGRDAYGTLNEASAAQVKQMLARLGPEARRQLVAAMQTIQQLLGESRGGKVPYILRTHQPGDLGWVVHRHGIVYANEYGWHMEFEGLVAEIVSTFAKNYDPQRERCWIAEKDGENVGSVFLVKKTETVAQLRLLMVEAHARGLGVGQRLVAECTRFAKLTGYSSIELWTNSVLHSARRLYEAEGYVLVQEEPHRSFGTDLVGQYWRLPL